MSTLEDYEKLRGEINQIFREGDNLVDGDEFWLELISDSMEPKEVLEIAKDMKEKGNSFYNSGKFENALEAYGYAEAILARYKFEEEDDRAEFCELALKILLNSTACFSKLKEFVEVGQICSIILEFQPENIKALYRRAMAAVELERYEWAFWDLVSAVQLDPDNHEIVKKMEQVKNQIKSKKSKNQTQGECPKGLGQGLPPPVKKPQHDLAEIHTSYHHEFQGNESTTTVNEEDIGDSVIDVTNVRKTNELDMYNKEVEECSKGSEEVPSTTSMEEGPEVIKDEQIEDKLSASKEDDNLSSVCTNEDETLNLAEPKCRFHNRKKHGSIITISRNDYLLMTKSKSLKYFDAKSGSFMEVRIARKREEGLSENCGEHIPQKACSKNAGIQPSLKKEKRDKEDSMEVSFQAYSCVTSDDDQYSCIESGYRPKDGVECTSKTKKPTIFFFSANPKTTARKIYGAKKKNRGSHPTSAMGNKRRKILENKIVPSFPTNFCGCRFRQDKKRKDAHVCPMEFYHHPRKAARFDPPPVCRTYLSTIYRDDGTNASNVGNNSCMESMCNYSDVIYNRSNGSSSSSTTHESQ